ncbi:protein of unknown function - conserved [Leishmania donovani]|uniref:Uncharacterized protein n=2 Tax=Leishmania donovani TaxID=5661 RepID=A0A504XGZ0_LEIDO|nr:hypothetical protein CGC20_15625 [Leishmania donovani]CAJ1993022.1 protein of unknown function - conserved [Leishmania donovani]
MSHNEQVVHHQQAACVKKLRFDDSVCTAMSGSSETWLTGADSSARSALKTSPTGSNPSYRASSLRRPSEAASAHSDAHVQLNPKAEVIEHDGSITTVNATTMEVSRSFEPVEESAGEVANFLADVGTGVAAAANMSATSLGASLGTSLRTPTDMMAASAASASQTTSDDPSERFRSLLLQLSSLTLEHRPKDPEQYIIDHLNARLLSSTASARASLAGCTTTAEEDGESTGATETTATAGGPGATLPACSRETSTTAFFTPHGDTVVERLASNALLSEVGRAVMTRLAELLISAQPEDPEDFLWARLEARSFGEDATHSVVFSADGYPVVRPEDPTQVSLLKDIPATSPGYVVATGLLPLLFAKKPVDPISYLFYHIGSRARSSAAQSAHSSTRHLRFGEEDEGFDAESCTSRELDDDSNYAADDAAEVGSIGGSISMVPLQRKGSLGSLFDNAAAAQLQRRRSDRSDNTRQRLSQSTAVPRSSSMRRSGAGATRASRDTSAAQSLPQELAALGGAGSSLKRVSVTQHEGKSCSPMRIFHESSPVTVADIGSSSTRTFRIPSLTASPNTLHNIESDEHARVRNEFGILRLREELRLERLQHEVRILTRECEYRNHMALLNRTDRMADRAAATAQEALEEAQKYRAFLCTQIDQLEVEKQRQLRLISQHMAQSSPALSAAVDPRIASPISGHCLGAESSLLYAEPQVPSELDILKKQVELLAMEQARARSIGYGVAPSYAAAAPHTTRFSVSAAGVSGAARASFAK